VKRRQSLKLISLCALGVIPALMMGSAVAQQASDYPSRPVMVAVGYPAGGPADMAARIVTEELAKLWKQPIVIENKPGANATIATADVARATPDGYKLLLAAGNHTTNKFVYKDLRYGVEDSFVPVALISQTPTVLATNIDFPANTVPELIELLRKNPGKYTYSSTGYGSTSHLAAELFKQATNTDITHVPYKGVGQAVTDIMGGNIDMVFPSLGSVMTFFDSGKLKPIAVATPQRLPELKDVPTFSEQGLPGFEVQTWYGLLAPAGTPKEIVDKINRDVNQVLSNPDVQKKLLIQGTYAAPRTPEQFKEQIHAEVKRMEALSKRVDLSAGK